MPELDHGRARRTRPTGGGGVREDRRRGPPRAAAAPDVDDPPRRGGLDRARHRAPGGRGPGRARGGGRVAGGGVRPRRARSSHRHAADATGGRSLGPGRHRPHAALAAALRPPGGVGQPVDPDGAVGPGPAVERPRRRAARAGAGVRRSPRRAALPRVHGVPGHAVARSARWRARTTGRRRARRAGGRARLRHQVRHARRPTGLPVVWKCPSPRCPRRRCPARSPARRAGRFHASRSGSRWCDRSRCRRC